MANIRKINGKTGVSYKITVTTGRDFNGKQIRHYKTWTPDKTMTARQMEKEARRVAIDFERDIEAGFHAGNKQTLAQYAEYFLSLKEQEGVSRSTIGLYKKNLYKRILPELGHMRLMDIKPQHLTAFYKKISTPGESKRGKYFTATPQFYDEFKALNIQKKQFAELCGLSVQTISTLVNIPGLHVNNETAEKIATQLKKPLCLLFDSHGNDSRLSPHYIKDIHRCISTVLAQAEKEMILKFNPASRATAPIIEKHIPNYFQPEQIGQILEALESEDIKWRMMIQLFIVTGCRRGEIIALTWDKIDFEKKYICIDSSANLDKITEKPYIGKTKNGKVRFVPIADEIICLLKKYRLSQMEERLKCGSLWEGTNYVFTNKTGGMLNPGSVNPWLNHFSKRHSLPHINPHAFRHTAASIMLANGVDIATVSNILGHSKISMTADVYTHVIEESKRRATDCMADVILRKKSV